jgi:hypothetical protein
MQLIQKPIQSAQQAQAAQVTNFTSGLAWSSYVPTPD